ncbi:MAG: hypothetical protein HQL20_03365 [Candidatus Omnitrophica bacterium]|nr:hypothetical protein [Candidatus Omnitrophota bacterium]
MVFVFTILGIHLQVINDGGFALNTACEKLPQLVAEIDGQNPPRAVAGIPWGHNAFLLEKLKDPLKRLWYSSIFYICFEVSEALIGPQVAMG